MIYMILSIPASIAPEHNLYQFSYRNEVIDFTWQPMLLHFCVPRLNIRPVRAYRQELHISSEPAISVKTAKAAMVEDGAALYASFITFTFP